MPEDKPMVTPTVAKLVTDHKHAAGKSYRQIAADSGVALSTVHKMAAGQLRRVPTQRIAHGLAGALGVDPQVILRAAALDLTLDFRPGDGDRTAVYLGMADLSQRQRRLLVDVMNDMRGLDRQEHSRS